VLFNFNDSFLLDSILVTFNLLESSNYWRHITSIVLIIVWFLFIRINLENKVKHFGFSRFQQIYMWFIPIMNLFKPYMMVRELFYESEYFLRKSELLSKNNFKEYLLTTWWVFHIITFYVNSIFNSIIKSTSLDFSIFNSLLLISNSIDLLAKGLFIYLIFCYLNFLNSFTEFENKLRAEDLRKQN
jgi:hypothetical protein